MIYLDNAATSPMDPEVVHVVQESMESDFANSGTPYKIGLDAKSKIENAKEEIAQALKIPPDFDMVFTSGGSESNNLFIKSVCYPDKKAACLGLEHPSVVEVLNYFGRCGNEPLILTQYLREGRMDLSACEELKRQRARLLCLSHVNNELGSVNDPVGIGRALKAESPQTRLFMDGVQALGKVPMQAEMWEFLSGYSLSAHKVGGPKGIGLLIYPSRMQLDPQIHGGGQQGGARSGTLATPLILGLARALQLARERSDEFIDRCKRMNTRLVNGLREIEQAEADFKIRFNSSIEDSFAGQSPAILNFSFPPVEGEVLLHHLEEKEIYVGMGSACSAHSKEPSKILTGIGLTKEEARCSLRISFGSQNCEEDVDVFLREFVCAWRALYPAFCQSSAS